MCHAIQLRMFSCHLFFISCSNSAKIIMTMLNGYIHHYLSKWCQAHTHNMLLLVLYCRFLASYSLSFRSSAFIQFEYCKRFQMAIVSHLIPTVICVIPCHVHFIRWFEKKRVRERERESVCDIHNSKVPNSKKISRNIEMLAHNPYIYLMRIHKSFAAIGCVLLHNTNM